MSDGGSLFIPSAVILHPPSVALRSYVSTHHLWAARHFRNLVRDIENRHAGPPVFDIRHRTYAINAVHAAVNFMEAAINEVLQDAADGHLSYVGCLPQRARTTVGGYWRRTRGRGSALKKYQLALQTVDISVFDPEADPYRGVALLIRLRDPLVHFRPETAKAVVDDNLETQLRGRFTLNPLSGSGNPFFPDKCLGAGCAEWATMTAQTLADEAFWRMGLQPNYQRVGWADDGTPLLPLEV